MNLDVNHLPEDPSHLKAIIISDREKIQYLEEQIRLFKNEICGMFVTNMAVRPAKVVDDEGPTVKIAPSAVQFLPKSMATAGLVAHIVTAKFEDALPLYRQEKIFARSYMWVFRGGDPDRPSLIYQYHPTRSGQVPLRFLNGYKGYVQTDGYNGYEGLGRRPGVVLVGCWAHARRKFDKVIKAMGSPKKQSAADEALDYIRQLYAIEKLARQEGLDFVQSD